MCGIVFLAGPQASSRIARCTERIRHRGPDDLSIWSDGDLALGFTRLEINGVGTDGQQPYRYGSSIGAVVGEIYNYRALISEQNLAPSACDAHVLLPLLERSGVRVIDQLDGFYSAIVLHSSVGEVVCLRDHMGKKPLFVGRSKHEIFVTSELKAFDEIEWFESLPLGVSCIDPTSGEVRQCADHRAAPRGLDVVALLEEAVCKRLPSVDQRVGVLLSGGLDSALIATFVARHRPDATYFTLGDDRSSDRRAVETVAEALGLEDVRRVPLPEIEQIPGLVRRVVYAAESYNPSIASNGLATLLLAQAVHDAGIKVVLTGEGADELFGGYHMLNPADSWRQVRGRLINDMHFTELRRLDLCTMACGVEARCPFLDRSVRAFSEGLDYEDLYSRHENKAVIRKMFEGLLPPEILHRKKTSLDVGSGVRAMVVQYLRRNGRSERDELRDIWQEQFSFDASAPYFHSYPAFDAVIETRGSGHR